MKNFLLSIAAMFLLPPALLAQSDIPVHSTGPFITIGRGLIWGSSNGSSPIGINNGFFFTPFSPTAGSCIYVTNNNPANAHPFLVTVYASADPSAPGFFQGGNVGGRWAPVYTAVSPITVAAAATGVLQGTQNFYVNTTGAAKVEVVFSNTTSLGGSPDSADVMVTQTSSGCGWSGPVSLQGSRDGTNATDGYYGQHPSVYCDRTATATAASGTTVVLASTGGSGNQTIHVCSYAISGGGVATTAAPLTIGGGISNSSCATVTSNWVLESASAELLNFALSTGPTPLFVLNNNSALCYKDGGTSTGSTISVSYTIF